MTVDKKFYEAASKDEALRAEVEQAAFEALADLLKEKGLEEEATKVLEDAILKVAEAHGLKPEENEKLDLDELDAVAGGACGCVVGGGGKGTGKECVCVIGGKGHNWSHKACFCPFVGGGVDD